MQQLRVSSLEGAGNCAALLVRDHAGVNLSMAEKSLPERLRAKVMLPQTALPGLRDFLAKGETFQHDLIIDCGDWRLRCGCQACSTKQQRWAFILILETTHASAFALLSHPDANRLRRFLDLCLGQETRRRKVRSSRKVVFGLG